MCGLSELVAYVEAGAHLDKLVGRDNTVTVAVGAGVPVAYHLSDVGVNEPQVFHQADERFALRFRPGVGGTAFLVQSAHVADTYASAVLLIYTIITYCYDYIKKTLAMLITTYH